MLNNEFPPLGGGTATVNAEILHCLRDATNLEIDLITSALGNKEERSELAANIRLFRVPVENKCIHHSSNQELLRYGRRAYRLAAKLHREAAYDLCLAWSAVPAGAVALALHYRLKLPYFVRVCGPDIPGFEHRYRWLYPLLSPLIKKVWRNSLGVIAKCEPEAELVRDIDSSISPRIIRNGVNLTTFSTSEVKKSLPPRIVCVARLIERKGQEVLLRACAQLRERGIEFRLRLVGTGDSEQRYRELTEQLSLNEQVEFRGMVSREQMPEEYAQSDIFVLPSENEGMSVASLEALAAGLPLLLSPTPGSELLLKSGVNGYYFPIGDADALGEKLEQLLCSEEQRRGFGEASKTLAEQYQWSEVAEEYQRLFQAYQQNTLR